MTVDDYVWWTILYSAVPLNLYVAFYLFRPWVSTSQGRALMTKALGNLLIIDLLLVLRYAGDFPGRDVVRVAGFTLFAAGMTYLLVSMLTSPGARKYPPFKWPFRWRRDDRRPSV